MKDLRKEAQSELIEEFSSSFKTIWGKCSYITDEQARAKATNGILVAVGKTLQRMRFPATVNGNGAQDAPPVQNAPQGPKDAQERTKTIMELLTPKGKMVALLKDEVAHYDGAFEPDKLVWHHCPICGEAEIEHEKSNGKGTWLGCYECEVFLNRDGRVVPMGGSSA